MFFFLCQDKLVNTVTHTGLVTGHAYSVTGVTEVGLHIWQLRRRVKGAIHPKKQTDIFFLWFVVLFYLTSKFLCCVLHSVEDIS